MVSRREVLKTFSTAGVAFAGSRDGIATARAQARKMLTPVSQSRQAYLRKTLTAGLASLLLAANMGRDPSDLKPAAAFQPWRPS
jgi:hypothetical protein